MVHAKVVNGWSHIEFCQYIEQLSGQFKPRNLFINSAWLNSWATSTPLPTLVLFFNDEGLIGLVFVGSVLRKSGPFRWHHALVNQSGIPEHDQVWVEYNRIFCAAENEQKCITALIEVLNQEEIDELTVSLAPTVSGWIKATEKNWYTEVENCFGAKVSLTSISDELSYLSKNTRYQVRKSAKLLQENFGKLLVRKARSAQEKLDYFDLLSNLHIEKWCNSEFGSGFNNQIFRKHLLTLILDYPDNAELIAVYAGSILIGVSLNLIDEHHVGFYCSGINYNIPNKKIKPGYIFHTQMIKHYKSLGKHEYDFLAGYAQYKQSLSTEVYNLKTLRLTKRNLRGTLIHLLRSLKQLFFKLKQKTKT